jgi:CRISPR system Cascade subunit CasE
MGELHLVQVSVDLAGLMRRARDRGQRLDELDTGYLLHGWLEETFGPGRLRPFRIEHGRGSEKAPDDPSPDLRLLAWSEVGEGALQQHVQEFAEPTAARAVHGVASKLLPETWTEGRRLGFAVRVCPTVRSRVPLPGEAPRDTPHERDAWQPGPDAPTREAVYVDWLRSRLDTGGVVSMERAGLDGYRRARLHRRTQGAQRAARQVGLPEAWMSGVLVIREPARFSEWLRHGVGRHRAFGFGMVVLRPAP